MMGRKPLFPGKDTGGQVDLIFSVLGTPSYKDLQFIQRVEAKKYITKLRIVPKVPFSKLYPKANPQALDLLEKMLKFNPNDRISVDEALAHPYFSGFRDARHETICDKPFDFKFEDDLDATKINEKEMRCRIQQLMWDECEMFMPSLKELNRKFEPSKRKIRKAKPSTVDSAK